MNAFSCDVAILGGGLAGSLLAYQLRLYRPELTVVVLERATDTAFKVGEATVELFTNYLTRRLGMSTYMYEAHLPKNGLRFYFDNPAKDAPLTAMSELGSQGLPFHPSFQIDRARLERDLRTKNRARGVDLREGAKVVAVELGDDDRAHTVHFEHGGARETVAARWVVDATGRTSLLAKQLDLRVPVTDHGCASGWARYAGVVDLDGASVDAAFRARVRNTSRRLSTVHFCHRGYWIWLIPLRTGDDTRTVTSIGVVGDHRHFDRAWLTPDGLDTFLRSHGALGALLDGAEPIDFGGYGQLAYGTKRFFGERWALIGEAACFTDPFYSPGSDFIALENDFVTDLIGRERDGETVAARAATYDEYLQFRFAANLALYRDQYELLGSHDLLQAKWELDITSYYNLWVHGYMLDQHLDVEVLRQDLRQKGFVLRALEGFGRAFAAAERAVTARGDYHRANLGGFAEALRCVDFVREVGVAVPREVVDARALAAFRSARARLGTLVGHATEPTAWSYADFVTGRAFAATAG